MKAMTRAHVRAIGEARQQAGIEVSRFRHMQNPPQSDVLDAKRYFVRLCEVEEFIGSIVTPPDVQTTGGSSGDRGSDPYLPTPQQHGDSQ